jgi:phenylpropionate dioxygenase-like ring-hydroxylating dioxygenase large terminal subunit
VSAPDDRFVPVADVVALGAGPVGVRVGDRAIVVFRDRGGRLGALPDRCPHRGMALSTGSIGFFGELVCGYHGWAWDVDGTCVRIPMSHATMRPAQARLAPFEVCESGGRVWVAVDGPGPAPAGQSDRSSAA